ncbi:SAM-dependent methyltransferase [Phyllobacterium zundukense]|uniref:SAM-dependent methyltransferase n=1 Tax=Phyllobacterium zundukense TaxID=1867719 RepID=A0A2N9VV53_9HYPH|nr:SAM-dependent methyltransferase [Phyllobacterium zundukense]ATU94974.1 SAM-dependent methyltransferase [Phyllobacterium zundukense]PIO43371.1 SAM-dependent methyltransferase [Phyllobacterium zundukense]
MRVGRLLPVSLISAATLAHEVLLMRLFSIIQWHHFAYMIISIALLGFGASGTFVAFARRPLVERYPAAFAASAALFGITAVASFAGAERLPFNALEIVWNPGQLGWLAASYALLILPFFFGATCIGLAFSRHPGQIGRVYAFDLVGAGIGALGTVGLLFLVFPSAALRFVAALGFVAAALAATGMARHRWLAVGSLGLAAAVIAVWLPSSWTAPDPYMSQYKGLRMALEVPNARVVEERSSPLGLLTVVESPTVPFRYVPGLSLANTQEPPAQLAVFTDGDSITAITAYGGTPATVAYLDRTTAALPYRILERPRMLILGAGGGEQVLLALRAGADTVDAVEVNPQMIDLVRNRFADFDGGIFSRPNVHLHLAEARAFAATTGERYDLIQMPLLDSFSAAAAGVQSMHENYTYTAEALRDYLAVLKPDGVIAITRWLRVPPRDILKLFATATAALEADGVAEPGRHLALIRSWNTATLLVAKSPFMGEDVTAIRGFAAENFFDISWAPGISASDVNRYNQLDQEYLYEGALALLGPERADFTERYKFDIAPATDNRPYFFDFFRWRALPELLTLRTQGGAAMLDWGYLILVTTLVQAAVLSAVLILLPLWLRRRALGGAACRLRFGLYFLALGLAFLFIEIAFIQRFVLFLGHPLYAVAVVLAGFLAFAGLGSAVAARWMAAVGRGSAVRGIALAVVVIAFLAATYLLALPLIFERLLALPDAAKIAIALLLIAPLAVFMGMPFPLGLGHVGARSEAFIPWAWGINGCASVLSAILAPLLAMHVGFTGVVTIATVLYLVAPALLAGSWDRYDQQTSQGFIPDRS